jgi:hypothetical protein
MKFMYKVGVEMKVVGQGLYLSASHLTTSFELFYRILCIVIMTSSIKIRRLILAMFAPNFSLLHCIIMFYV